MPTIRKANLRTKFDYRRKEKKKRKTIFAIRFDLLQKFWLTELRAAIQFITLQMFCITNLEHTCTRAWKRRNFSYADSCSR